MFFLLLALLIVFGTPFLQWLLLKMDRRRSGPLIAVLMLLPSSFLVWGFGEWAWGLFRISPRDRIALVESYTEWGAVRAYIALCIVTLPYLLAWWAIRRRQVARWRARGDAVFAPGIWKPLCVLFTALLVVTLYLYQHTSLENAVRSNDVELTRKRLEFNLAGLGPDNADVRYISSGERFTMPMLPIAVENGNIEMVDLLLEYGAEINTEKLRTWEYLQNPLRTAITQKDNRMLRHLLERGADPNQGISDAASEEDIEAVRLLVEAGADPSKGVGPAAERNDLEMVRLLLEAGADPSQGVGAAAAKEAVAVLDLLLRAGGEPSWGVVPAIRRYDDFLLEYLYEMGADPSCALMSQQSLITDVLARLLEEGADLGLARRKVAELHRVTDKHREALMAVLEAFGGERGVAVD